MHSKTERTLINGIIFSVIIVTILYYIFIWSAIRPQPNNINTMRGKSITHIKTLTGYAACDRISYLMLSIGNKRNKGVTIYTLFTKERSLPKNDIYITNILTKYAYAHPEYDPKELRLQTLQECDRIVLKVTHVRIAKDVVI